MYHARGIEAPVPSSQAETIAGKRSYNKNPDNARWAQNLASAESSNVPSDSEKTDLDIQVQPENIYSSTLESESESIEAPQTTQKRKYTKKLTKKIEGTVSRFGRERRAPKAWPI